MEPKIRKTKVKIAVPVEEKGYKKWAKYLPVLLVVFIILIVLIVRGREKKIMVENAPSQEKIAAVPGAGKDTRSTGKLMVRIIPDVPTVGQDLEAAAADGGNASYKWEKNGAVIEGANTQRLSKDIFKKGDRISLIATSDGEEAEASVVIKNSPPEILAVRYTPERISRGEDIGAIPKGFDADGDEVNYRYQWIINGNEAAMEDKPVLKGDRFKRGDTVSAKIIPFDKDGDGVAYITRTLTIPNGPPRFTSSPPLEFKGFTYTYNAVAEDPDGDAVTYSLASAPNGMNINRDTGNIVWQFTKNDQGAHNIEVVAQDSEGMRGFQKYTLTITMPKEENK